jgi:hypothetical protein
VSVLTVPLYLAVGEVAASVLPLGLLATGALGVAGVLLIGTAVVRLTDRARRRTEDREEVTTAPRP